MCGGIFGPKLKRRLEIKMIKCKTQKIPVMLLLCGCIIFTSSGCLKNDIQYYYDTEEFNEETNSMLYTPEGANDLRMAVKDTFASKTMLCSYVLDDSGLSARIQKVTDEEYTRKNDDGSESVEFDEYYSIKVADIDNVNSSYTLDDFPYNLVFDAVIDDYIGDYTVIYYYPANSGTHGWAILYNDKTNRVIEYYHATMK